MGLIDFAKSVGRKLGLGDDEPAKGHATAPAGPAASAGPSPQQVKDVMDRRRASALVKLVTDMGFHVDELGIRVDGEKVTISGGVDTQANREKIVLLVGNVEGVGSVDDQLKVATPEAEATFYEVKSGDTLSKIAKHFYGDANKYHQIFEANKPMLKDADEIYPGQRLRIPGATHS
jgi:nucleoid-associated protein YgaU